MKATVVAVLCAMALVGPSLAAELPAALQEEMIHSDFVVLSASKGRNLFGIKGLGGDEKLDPKKIMVLRFIAKAPEPGLVIKKRDAFGYSRYVIRNGAITVNRIPIKISDVLDAMKIPKADVAPVFVEGGRK